MKLITSIMESISLGPLRLLNILGFEQRTNDIIYCRPQKETENTNVLVFFGGDVQDFTENMRSHRDNKNYVKWNLENTAALLNRQFIHDHILIVHPHRMEYKTFSCYDNFVPCNQCGVPSHTSTNGGLTHLKKIIAGVSNRLKTMTRDDYRTAYELSKQAIVNETNDLTNPQNQTIDNLLDHYMVPTELEEKDIKLLGFSKGCIVLNQFLYEFNYYKTFTPCDSPEMTFITKIKDMYWLDGGHSGGKNTWITARQLLETLANLGIRIHIHVTPYQIEDERRPWIKKEEKTFSDVLIKMGAPVERKVHFEHLPASIVSHFNVLEEFTKV